MAAFQRDRRLRLSGCSSRAWKRAWRGTALIDTELDAAYVYSADMLVPASRLSTPTRDSFVRCARRDPDSTTGP